MNLWADGEAEGEPQDPHGYFLLFEAVAIVAGAFVIVVGSCAIFSALGAR